MNNPPAGPALASSYGQDGGRLSLIVRPCRMCIRLAYAIAFVSSSQAVMEGLDSGKGYLAARRKFVR